MAKYFILEIKLLSMSEEIKERLKSSIIAQLEIEGEQTKEEIKKHKEDYSVPLEEALDELKYETKVEEKNGTFKLNEDFK